MMPNQQRRALGAVEAKTLVSREVAAGPDPDLEAAAAHQVKHRGILRHPDRQLERQGDDPGPQADPCGLRGDLGEEHEGRRQATFALVKMVLCDPGRIEAAALGMHDLGDGQSVALGRVRLIEQAGEETQAYRRLCSRQPLNLVLCRRGNQNIPVPCLSIPLATGGRGWRWGETDFSLWPSVAPS